MYYAIISDVHATLEALEAVLKDIKKRKIGHILFLGDAVGYGPNPNECIEVIQKIAKVFLMGNHDSAVIGLTDLRYFNPDARTAIEWTEDILTEGNKAFLKSLPIFKRLENEDIYPVRKKASPFSNGVYLVHSSPKEPEQWHYILNTWDAHINFHFFTEKICFIGHTHYPFITEMNPEGNISVYKDYADFKEDCRYIINVGSVGQPRDSNPDASYAVLNGNSVEIKRVSYDILSTQKKMREAGLPPHLIERLSRGI